MKPGPQEKAAGPAQGLAVDLEIGEKSTLSRLLQLAGERGEAGSFPLTLRVYAKHGHRMDDLGCIQRTPQRQNVSHTSCFECKTACNLIDFINISKERMCQSERGFGGED